ERGISCGQLTVKIGTRPAVGNDVMKGQPEHVLIWSEPQEQSAKWRAGAQVKLPAAFFIEDAPGLCVPCFGRDLFQVDLAKLKGGCRTDALKELAFLDHESRPQKVVPLDDAPERDF